MIQPGQTEFETIAAVAAKEINRPQELRNFRVSLKQWRMLHAVVSCGSFANAAEYLHVSQPAISYAIAKLEEQLGLPLLKLCGRKAQITEPGSVLLERSRFLLREAVELEAFAENLRQGCGPEIRLAVNQNFPTPLLIPALRTFSIHGPNTKVHLIEMSMPEIDRALQGRAADLAINGRVPSGFQGDLLIEMEYVPVAHPDHSLFELNREVTQADLEREVQVVSNSEIAAHINEEKHHGAGIARRWHVSNFDTAVSALSECLGYGWLPKNRIRKSLDKGTLKILPLRNGATYKSNFYLIHARPSMASSQAIRLAEVLHGVAATNSHYMD